MVHLCERTLQLQGSKMVYFTCQTFATNVIYCCCFFKPLLFFIKLWHLKYVLGLLSIPLTSQSDYKIRDWTLQSDILLSFSKA